MSLQLRLRWPNHDSDLEQFKDFLDHVKEFMHNISIEAWHAGIRYAIDIDILSRFLDELREELLEEVVNFFFMGAKFLTVGGSKFDVVGLYVV